MSQRATTTPRGAPARRSRSRAAAVVLGASTVALAPGAVRADPAPRPEVAGEVSLDCERVGDVGRVRCTVELRVPAGRSVRWADVVLTALPPFALALKGRLGPDEAAAREPSFWRWPFAVAARSAGEGVVEARVRFVECTAKSGCEARELTARGALVVGR